MKKFDKAKKVIESNGGIAEMSDLISAEITVNDITALCKNERLYRLRHGFYCLSDNIPSDEQLLSVLLPEGIVCLGSALYHYGYSDYAPLKWSVTVPREISLAKLKIDMLPLEPHFAIKKNYNLGKTHDDFNGVTLAVYDRERTICDCFKFRSRLDTEIFAKAVNAYIADDNKNLAALSRYSRQLRVYKKVSEMMEVLLNG